MSLSRLSEQNFNRFEPVFIAAINGHLPHEIDCVAVGLAPTTIAARLRDAALAYQKYNYDTVAFTREEFDRVWPMCEVRLVDTRVIVSKRGQRQQLSSTVPMQKVTVLTDHTRATPEQIQAALVLLTGKFIEQFPCPGWTSDELLAQIAVAKADCSVVTDEGTNILI